jgi:hypothetical protein
VFMCCLLTADKWTSRWLSADEQNGTHKKVGKTHNLLSRGGNAYCLPSAAGGSYATEEGGGGCRSCHHLRCDVAPLLRGGRGLQQMEAATDEEEKNDGGAG